MNAVIEGNWKSNALAKFNCGGLNNFELKSLNIVFAYEFLLAKNPDLIPQNNDSPIIDESITLVGLYNKIICGTLLTETEYEWALAEISRLMKVYYESTDSQTNAAVELATYYVYAAGIHTWAGGAATTDSITVASLLVTDVVTVTMHTQGASEVLVKAAAAAGQINLTLSANGTDGTTKLNYVVHRAMPTS